LKDHLDRWENSVSERRYTSLGYDREQVAEVLHGCVARGNLRESMITFVATRGSPSTAHKDLRTCNNRFMVWALPYCKVVSDEELADGSGIVIANTIRIPPEAVDPHVKNFGRLDFVRALFEAYDRDARYAVLLDRDDNVTEGRGWNIFALTDGVLLSPDSGVLEGITRKTVVELSARLNIDCRLTNACEIARPTRCSSPRRPGIVPGIDGVGRGRQSQAGDDAAQWQSQRPGIRDAGALRASQTGGRRDRHGVRGQLRIRAGDPFKDAMSGLVAFRCQWAQPRIAPAATPQATRTDRSQLSEQVAGPQRPAARYSWGGRSS
jgi:hypothetical protein